MNENTFAASTDDTFFGLMDGLFSRRFSTLAEISLAANEEEIDDEDIEPTVEQREAAIRRHPSARRRC